MPPYLQEKPRQPRPAPLACTECRRRHLKCDASQPVCSRCVETNHHCSYQKSRRGGKRKHPTFSTSGTSSPAGTDNAELHGVRTPPSGSQSWISSNDQQIQGSIVPSSPVPITQHQATSSPHSLRSLRLPRVLTGNVTPTRSSVEETLVELYYENFHRAHPILLPKSVYDSGRQLPRYLNAVIQYIGSHYSAISTSALRTLTTTELIHIPESVHCLAVVQAKLLFAIVLYSDGDADGARKWLSAAIDVAVSLGMNKKSFADLCRVQQGVSTEADLEAESARRTWWELYVFDGLISALDHRAMSNFRMSIIPSDVEMPCEEVVYAEGRPIPPPSPREELESRIFRLDDEDDQESEGFTTRSKAKSLSSFTYRVDAIDLLAQVLAVRDPNRARRDKTQAVDNTLASWAHYLPTSKADIVNGYGEIDEMLLQAHMIVQLSVVLLHFPRSNLTLNCSSSPTGSGCHVDTSLFHGPLAQKYPPSSTRHIHGIKATEASKRLSNLFSLCTSMQKHSPLFMFSLSLCGNVQLATYCEHVRLDASLSCLDQHRARVRLIVGLLKSCNEIWPLSKTIQRGLKIVAAKVFDTRKFDVQPMAVLQSSTETGGMLRTNSQSDVLFQLDTENVWMPMDGQYTLPELAPWVWG